MTVLPNRLRGANILGVVKCTHAISSCISKEPINLCTECIHRFFHALLSGQPQGHSPVLHCTSLLRMISHVIGTCAFILVPRGRAPFGQHQESRPLAESNTGSPRFTDFPSLCACSESSLTNLIGSGINLLCLLSHSKTERRWTRPEVAILGADQKERGLWGREWCALKNGGFSLMGTPHFYLALSQKARDRFHCHTVKRITRKPSSGKT